LDILSCYYSQQPPKPGQSLYFQLPGEKETRNFYCPLADEEERLVADWALVPTFHILSIETFVALFTGLLLERSIVIVCRNPSTLSSIVLSVVPLLRPLRYQGLLIPILPKNLRDIMSAPVPFIVGIQQLTTKIEGIIIDADKNKVIYSNVSSSPSLPEGRKLFVNIKDQYERLRFISQKEKYYNPHRISDEQQTLATSILEAIHTYTYWFIERIKKFYEMSGISLDSAKNRELIRNKFLQTVSPINRDFVKSFLHTQQFSVYSHSTFKSIV